MDSFLRVGVLGASHQTASLELREKLAKAFQAVFEQGLASFDFHYVLLSTCNRTEVYFSAADLSLAHGAILQQLRAHMQDPCFFEERLYSFFGVECFAHLAQVIAGLESVILGECEIQKQVKIAYEGASSRLNSALHFLFQKALKIAKKVRSSSFFPRLQLTLERQMLELIQLVCKEWRTLSFLFIGNSEINRRIFAYFWQRGVRSATLITRAPHLVEAKTLAVGDWDLLPTWTTYDVVISGTHAERYLIGAEKSDEVRSRLLFDLSVPRSIDPLLAHNPHTMLWNIEQLGTMIEEKRSDMSSEKKLLCEEVRLDAERHMVSFARKAENISQRTSV